MKVLVVGGGGREHAIIWKLSQSPKVDKLYCAPGNAGIKQLAECINVSAEDIAGIVNLAGDLSIDLAVIGPEVPLAMGITDELIKNGIRVFGPNKKCAQLEASKSFTKKFLVRHNIPTAGYREFTDKDELIDNLGLYGYPMVLKADGLAAGKGVIIAENEVEARTAAESMMSERAFGSAGDKVVVEEYLSGVEASMLCFVDGSAIIPMESAQDYKRIFDDDKGPNTGGMGTYSPSLVFTPELEKQIKDKILTPTFEGFKEDGLDFTGVLFIGLMITAADEDPKVIEFNNRFGDPEAQSVLPRMETDLMDVFLAATENKLDSIDIKWKDDRAVCVVMASGGYPGAYNKGIEIDGLCDVDCDIIIYHAGTGSTDEEGKVVTSGGRVLGVTALGKTHEEAREKAYKNISRIHFNGAQYRKDIGIVSK